MGLEQAYKKIRNDIKPFEPQVRLIAVSKKQSPEKIRRLHALGQKDFAENYLQEAIEKQTTLNDLDIRWHYVGRLQSKKIKAMMGRFDLIHSVSRLKEVSLINEEALSQGVQQEILLQVNIACEVSKQGFTTSEIMDVAREVQTLKGLRLRGLMVFPPLGENTQDVEAHFAQGHDCFQLLQQHFGGDISHLSMGTSRDYLLALRHGATDIRVGESLMGARPPL